MQVNMQAEEEKERGAALIMVTGFGKGRHGAKKGEPSKVLIEGNLQRIKGVAPRLECGSRLARPATARHHAHHAKAPRRALDACVARRLRPRGG